MIKVHHLGIALADHRDLARMFEVLGFPISHEENVPSENVITRFIPISSPSLNLEFLEPTTPDSAVGKFLAKRGSGVHHISLEVENVDEVSMKLKAEGFKLIYPEARPGAHQARVNFIHPSSASGILVEIAQYPPRK